MSEVFVVVLNLLQNGNSRQHTEPAIRYSALSDRRLQIESRLQFGHNFLSSRFALDLA